MENKGPTKIMQKLIEKNYSNRFWITVFTLGIFLALCVGIGLALLNTIEMSQEWKEILLLVLGAFIGSYSKVIDFWFNNTERDREMMHRADAEDGLLTDPTVNPRGVCSCACPDCQMGATHHHHINDVPHGLEP